MVLGHVDFKAFCTFCVFDMVCNIYLLDLVNILYRSWKRKWKPYSIEEALFDKELKVFW